MTDCIATRKFDHAITIAGNLRNHVTVTCYAYGDKKDVLGLHERVLECEYCRHILNRDHNPALNIKKVGTSTFTPRDSQTGSRSTHRRRLA